MKNDRDYLSDNKGKLTYISTEKVAELMLTFGEFTSNRASYNIFKNIKRKENRKTHARMALESKTRVYREIPRELFEEIKKNDKSLEPSLRVLESECLKDL